ncbi:Retrovirus-related Pol poly from transposon opus, partial [Paramuricea clavata]
MAKVLNLPKLQPFTLGETSTISQQWRKWIKSFEYYIAASGINDKKQQRAILLHLAGPEVQDIFETLEDTGNDLDTAIAKLTSYFEPQKNIPFERHNFRQTTQLQGETIEQLAIRLKHQVKFCKYGNPNDMIRDQIIEHCSSSRLRRRLLCEPELTLEKTVEIGRSFEASERQASQIEADSLKTTDLGVNAIRSKAASSRYPTSIQTGRSNIVCYCCGNAGHRAKDPRCPAEGMSCNKCHKLGHFARVCRQLKPTNKPEFQNPTSKNKNEIYKQNTGSHGEIRYVYGAPHPATGESSSDDEVSHKDLITNAIFIVVANQNAGSLLGHKTATDLGLFQEHENFHPIQNICNGDNLFMQTLVTKYPQVFNGIGKLKDLQLHLHFDESVPPVAQAPRRIPFHIRKAVQTKLDELETLGIIEPVKGPSPWVSPLVAVPKPNGDIRVCVDM